MNEQVFVWAQLIFKVKIVVAVIDWFEWDPFLFESAIKYRNNYFQQFDLWIIVYYLNYLVQYMNINIDCKEFENIRKGKGKLHYS